jgi:hypothetical protein
MFSRKHIDTNVIMIYLYQVYKKLQKCVSVLTSEYAPNPTALLLHENGTFFGVFPMFVPSLFW